MNNYSEKEIQIFNGVLSLARQGKNIHAITSAQIAAGAGVGKGTIYEYFSSKEEIIIKAIIYSLQQENLKARRLIKTADSFKEKMFTLYDLVLQNVNNSMSSFNIIVSSGGFCQLSGFFGAQKQLADEMLEETKQVVKEIVDFAAANGNIVPPTDPEYIMMVFSSNILAVGKTAVEHSHTHQSADSEKIKENAFKMLIKALN